MGGSVDLLDSLSDAIYELRRIRIERIQFEAIELRAHLKIKVRVVDNNGAQLAIDSSLRVLQERFCKDEVSGAKTPATKQAIGHPIETSGLVVMPEKALPQSLEVGEGNIRLIRFPSLVDEGSSVSVCLFADEHQAGLAHSRGVVKLVMLNSLQQRNMLRKQFDRFVKQNALKLPVGSADFAEQCVEACYVEALEV
jgi:ATP-dependent helicase HrpA